MKPRCGQTRPPAPVLQVTAVFQSWSTKAQILDKLGRTAESAEVMKSPPLWQHAGNSSIPPGQLLAQQKMKDAFDAFKLNFDKNPNQFTTLVGLARGYSGLGDFKNAPKYATQALPLAPNQLNKTNVESMVEKLKAGKILTSPDSEGLPVAKKTGQKSGLFVSIASQQLAKFGLQRRAAKIFATIFPSGPIRKFWEYSALLYCNGYSIIPELQIADVGPGQVVGVDGLQPFFFLAGAVE